MVPMFRSEGSLVAKKKTVGACVTIARIADLAAVALLRNDNRSFVFLAHLPRSAERACAMAIMQHPHSGRGTAPIRYAVSVLFALAVIAAGVKIAVDHWPCAFNPRGLCSP